MAGRIPGLCAASRCCRCCSSGFSAGLPFYLVFQTLSAWLASGRHHALHRSACCRGSASPIRSSSSGRRSSTACRCRFSRERLGRRRSWMLLAQIGIAICHLQHVVESAVRLAFSPSRRGRLLLAFCAATQDIALDAWRVESVSVDLAGRDGRGVSGGLSRGADQRERRRFHDRRDKRRLATRATARWLCSRSSASSRRYWFTSRIRRSIARKRGDSEERVAGWLNRNSHLAPWMRAGWRVVHRCRRVPVHRLLHALRARVRADRASPSSARTAYRVHDGADGESVLSRSRLHAYADREGREGVWPRDVASSGCSPRVC